jgi:nitric oxide reductase subunit B
MTRGNEASSRRARLLVSKAWVQAAALVVLFGFFVLGLLAYRTYVAGAPIPRQVIAEDGSGVFSGEDVLRGQRIFLRAGLMEYGSIFGHGAYLGPDFTADYLRRAALSAKDQYARAGERSPSESVASDFKANRYDPGTGVLRFSAAQARAFQEAKSHYASFFARPSTETGLSLKGLSGPEDVHALTSFFAWSAWAASAARPGEDYSYTNNWPPEPLVRNQPTAATLIYSMLSLAALLGGAGLLFAAFGRYDFLGWHGRDEQRLRWRGPDEVRLTPGQRACAWFFLVMALLFLAQVLVGGASQHYRAEISNFFGIDLSRILPYNLARTWHVQLAIFWVATSFLAAGIFMAPLVAGHEPRHQHVLAYGLLGALAVVVAGSLAGELSGIHGFTKSAWFGNQGFEYLDLGRFWQVLLSVGLLAWAAILFRGLRGRLRGEHPGNMPWLFFFGALAIPAFYAVGLLARSDQSFTTTDFWRFWVVHLWVEDFLELFTTIMVAYIFVLLGVVAEVVALRLVYLDIILYSAGGVIGTMHHVYFSGAPVEHMALGAVFSAAEVIPLTFLTLESWSFLRLGGRQTAGAPRPFPHRWAMMFLVAVGFWNFVGAGIFGFLINLPIVSYYEIGTALTANHGHAAMMGVYGMLAVGLSLFGLRYLIPEERWSDRAAKVSFWCLNLGLAWMVFVTLFPLGLLQLFESVGHGYYEARTLKFLVNPTNRVLEWLRFPGDAVFIGGGVLPLLWLCWRGVRYRRREEAEEGAGTGALFTEVEPASAPPPS